MNVKLSANVLQAAGEPVQAPGDLCQAEPQVVDLCKGHGH